MSHSVRHIEDRRYRAKQKEKEGRMKRAGRHFAPFVPRTRIKFETPIVRKRRGFLASFWSWLKSIFRR